MLCLKVAILLRKFMSALNVSSWCKCIGIAVLLFQTACHHTPDQLGEVQKLYDFDHKVHYRQIQYSEKRFAVRILADSYRAFTQQSVFLLRHSRQLCKELVPQLTLRKGIQRFERLPTEPRPYKPDLYAEIKCIAP